MSAYDYNEVYHSPNYGYPKGSPGRRGQQIEAVCLHVSGATWESNRSWIMNPAANAGYNAIVKDDGSVASLVDEANAAYSHGKINRPTWPLLKAGVNPNLYTLSLARTGSNQNTWTPAQLEGTLNVLRHWGAHYGIPLKRPYIFGHFEIDSVERWYCPGRAFFDAVISALAAAEDRRQPGRPPGVGAIFGGPGSPPAGPDKPPVKPGKGAPPAEALLIPGAALTPGAAPAAPPASAPAGEPGAPAHLTTAHPTTAHPTAAHPTTAHPGHPAGHPGRDEPLVWYRVIAGSYRRPENAARRAAYLQELGVDAFVLRHPPR